VMPPKNKAIQATCRAVGQHVAVWIADADWLTTVTQDDVDNVMASMELTTPLEREGGVFGNNTRLFGMPPTVNDGEPALTILVYDIPGYKGYSFDGYFRAEDLGEFKPACETSPMIYCSNELPMIHVTSKDIGGDYMAGVIAHEFQHLIHFGQDPGEESWLDESLAELAMIHAGYDDPYNLKAFLNNPGSSLIVQPPVDYGACLLFGSFLWQLLGDEGITTLVEDAANGIASLEKQFEGDKSFPALFAEFSLSNLVGPSTSGWPAGHTLADPSGIAVEDWGSEIADVTVTVPPTASHYAVLAPSLDGQSLYLSLEGQTGIVVLFTNLHGTSGDLSGILAAGQQELVFPEEWLHEGKVYFAFANPSDAQSAVTLKIRLGPPIELPEPTPEAQEDIIEQSDLVEAEELVEEDLSAGVDATQADSQADQTALEDTNGNAGGGSGSSGGCSSTATARPLSAASLIIMALLLLFCARRQSPLTSRRQS